MELESDVAVHFHSRALFAELFYLYLSPFPFHIFSYFYLRAIFRLSDGQAPRWMTGAPKIRASNSSVNRTFSRSLSNWTGIISFSDRECDSQSDRGSTFTPFLAQGYKYEEGSEDLFQHG